MQPTPRPTAVVFDMDGLMFNTEELYEEVGGEMLTRRGKVCTRALLDRMMGRPSRVALQIMIDAHDLDDTIEQLQQETDEIFREILPDRLAPMPGLLALLDALEAASVPKAIATSSRREFLERVLGEFDLQRRFEFMLTSEDVRDGKPHPEIYLRAAERLGRPAAQVLVLEDSENGCRSAMAAGAFVVAVPGVQSTAHSFDGVDLIAEGLTDRRIYEALGLEVPI